MFHTAYVPKAYGPGIYDMGLSVLKPKNYFLLQTIFSFKFLINFPSKYQFLSF